MQIPFGRTLVLLLPTALGVPSTAAGQASCLDWHRPRAFGVGGAYVAGTAVTLAVRAGDWWRDQSTGSFKLVWDGTVSHGQDYLLRADISYQLSQLGQLGFEWACVPSRWAAWLAAAFSTAVWLPKEFGDGFHERGFSIADLTGSMLGAALPALRYETPVLGAIQYKFNYWPSEELRKRNGIDPQLESDYAGMRFFLAYNPGLVETNPDWWPDWLGVAIGHSIPHWVTQPPVHQWYLTFDLNARGLPIDAAWWPSVAAVLDQIKIPMPGLRLQGGSVAFGVF